MTGTDQDVKDLASYLNQQINGPGQPKVLTGENKKPVMTAHK